MRRWLIAPILGAGLAAILAGAAQTPAAPTARSGAAQQPAFAQALAPEPLEFPRDQGPHPDFRQEWWYLTGNLDAADGERFGFELTIFRFTLAPVSTSGPNAAPGSRADAERSAWRTREIYLGHFAVTDVSRHRFRFATKLSRGALGLAGAQADPFRVWVGNWRIAQVSGVQPISTGSTAQGPQWRLQADEPGYVLSLTARPLLAPVPNGEQGLSRKSAEPGNATEYYSIPRVAVRGTITRDGRPLAVQGLAWLDREWGSGSLGPQESGWDWFGLQLDDGSCLMFYALRDRDGAEDPFSAGTWIDAHGHAHRLARSDVRIEVLGHWKDRSGAVYPAGWRLVAPGPDLELTVHPALADQELTTSPRYWEGAVDVSGKRAGQPIAGRGYVELVGYAGAGAGAGSAGIR